MLGAATVNSIRGPSSRSRDAKTTEVDVTDKIVVLVTTHKLAEARKIARTLVEKQYAACVNILPQISSVYRWKDKIRRDPEILLVIKTRRHRFRQLSQCVESMHSYETPEVVVLPIVDGAANYLNWIEQSVPGEE